MRGKRFRSWGKASAFFISVLAVNAQSAQPSETKDSTIVHVVSWKPEHPESLDSAIATFEKRNPSLKVNLEVSPRSPSQLHDLLAQRLRSRDKNVDVFLLDVVWPAEFAQSGWLKPLDDRFPRTEQMKNFPGTVDAATYKGNVYGLPFYLDSGLLYYRKDLLEKYHLSPPKTWKELVSDSQKIVAGEKNPDLSGLSAQFKQFEGLVCNVLEYVHSNGGELLEPESPQAVDAVSFMKEEILGKAARRALLTYQEQESLDLFKAGGAVFHRNWPYAWKFVNDPKVSKIAGKVAISPLPTFKEGRNTATLGGWLWGMSAFTQHADASWKFISYMTSEEMQKHFALTEAKAPTRRALYADADILKENPHFKAMLPVFETAYPRPKTPIYSQVSNILQRYVGEAISDPGSDVPALAKAARMQIASAEKSILENAR